MIVQRADASVFMPNAETDPVFADTLRRVHKQGVEVIVYNCDVSTQGICIYRKVRAKIHQNYNK